MSYEQVLTAARLSPLNLPPFEAIANAADRDRSACAREEQDGCARARQWFWASAASWLLLPLDGVAIGLLGTHGVTRPMVQGLTLDVALMVLPPALISIWGARLTRGDRRFRSAILTRAIAVSNSIVALLYAASVGGLFGAAFASLLALASARILMLLGDRGLDGSDDPDTEFEPVRFRGVLIIALIMAFADALTLGFSSVVAGVRTLGLALAGYEIGLSSLSLTMAAALLMIVNVWGLLRLRVWALFGTMLSNIGIAALAMQGSLALNFYVAMGLTVTAAVQLLLAVPILAAALGDEQAGRSHQRLGKILRLVVPALVVATVVLAVINLGYPTLPDAWFMPHWPKI